MSPVKLPRRIFHRWTGVWPPATLVLSLPNDLIRWVPFGLYLYDAWPRTNEVSTTARWY